MAYARKLFYGEDSKGWQIKVTRKLRQEEDSKAYIHLMKRTYSTATRNVGKENAVE